MKENDQLDYDKELIQDSYNNLSSPMPENNKLVKGKYMYTLENNFYSLKIVNPNTFYSIRTADAFNTGNF